MKRLMNAMMPVLLAGTVQANVIYENDFSVRTSAKAIPSSAWQQSVPYHVGELYVPYTSYTAGNVFSDTAKIQDGWAKGYDGDLTKDPDFMVRADAGGNQFAAFINDGEVTDPSKDHNARAIHPFYNSITSGILRMQIDLRAPSSYPNAGNNNIFVGPYYRKYVNLNWGGTVSNRPGMFGFNLNGGQGVKTYIYGGNGSGTFDGSFGNKVTAGHWYRFVIDFNFDTKKLGGTVYDMGTDVPTFASTGTKFQDLPTKGFNTNPSAEAGPAEGICIADAGSVSGRGASEDLQKASCVDNIRLSWRASGTDFGANDVFYENDFSLRRGRTIVPGSSATSFTYTPPTGTMEYAYTGFTVNKYNDVVGATNCVLTAPIVGRKNGQKVAQPYGLDGWRRMNCDGLSDFSIVNPSGNGGNRLMVSGPNATFGIVSQPIGDTITTGDVKLSFDFRPPSNWYHSSRLLYAMLAGDDYLNSGDDNTQSTCYAARLGVNATSQTAMTFASRAAGDFHYGNAATGLHYYRGIMTVHLDANPRTVDLAIYDMGTSSRDGSYEVPTDQQPVYERSGETIYNNASFKNITCVAFYVSGVAGREGGKFTGDNVAFLDNIKVWKKASSVTDWTKVYYNDFTTRVRYQLPAPYPFLVPDIGRFGVDGWVKRHNALNPLLITPDENPALYGNAVSYSSSRLTSDGSYTWAMQQLGTSVRKGKVTMQVDMRPPRTWTEKNYVASVVLGNDLYYQGVQQESHPNYFLKEYQVRFGFAQSGTTANTNGRYPTTKLFYRPSSGNTLLNASVDPTHWYRFVVESDVTSGKYDLAVYDLGTAHPTFATATPAATLAEVKDIGYCNALEAGEGLSTLGVTVQGVREERPWETDDPGLVLIDNIRITRCPPGMALFLR